MLQLQSWCLRRAGEKLGHCKCFLLFCLVVFSLYDCTKPQEEGSCLPKELFLWKNDFVIQCYLRNICFLEGGIFFYERNNAVDTIRHH